MAVSRLSISSRRSERAHAPSSCSTSCSSAVFVELEVSNGVGGAATAAFKGLGVRLEFGLEAFFFDDFAPPCMACTAPILLGGALTFLKLVICEVDVMLIILFFC